MIRLSDEFKEQRGRALTALVEQDVRDMRSRYKMVQEHRALYYGNATAMMPLPWEGASNIHIPLMQDKVEEIVPLVQSAFWGVDPVVNVLRSPEEYYSEQTDDVERFFNFVLDKDVPSFYETMECWMRDTCCDGLSVVKPYWVKSYRRVSEVHMLDAVYEAGELDSLGEEIVDARAKSAVELFVDLYGTPSAKNGLLDAVPHGDYPDDAVIDTKWDLVFVENSQVFRASAEILRSEYVDKVQVRVRRMIVDENCAHVDVLDYDECILPYRSKDIQTADRVTQKYWLTLEEVEAKKRSGEWDLSDEDLEVLRAKGTKEFDDDTQISGGLKRQKDNVLGEGSGYKSEKRAEMPNGFAAYDKNKIMVLLVFTKDDVEGDGIREEVIYHVPYGLRTIVRGDYLDEEFPHGKRPFIPAKYIPVSGRWPALGLGDQLSAINLEINTLFNIINNNQAIVNNPFFFYEPTAFNADNIRGIKPGEGISVLSVKGIMFPTFQHTPLTDMQTITSLMMLADRVTISPLNAGSTQMKNAPRTARGTLALLGEGHIKIDTFITRLQRTSWYELMEQVFGLYQELCPDEKWYWVVREGTRLPQRMTRNQLRGRYEFTFKGNTVNTNREVLRNIAQVRYATVMTHPDYATDPQVRQNALLDFLKFWGDGTDIDRLVPSLPGQGAFPHRPMRQQDENRVIELGVPVLALPVDNHAEHLQVMEQFQGTDAFKRMPEAFIGLWAAHRLQHEEYLRMEARTANMPVQPGMGNNVPLGVAQGNADQGQDLNALGGGNMR